MPLDREMEAEVSNLTKVLIHVPHSGTNIPSNEWQYFTTNNLKDEIIKMTDHYCDDLFSCMHEMISFPVSRLVCDAERFRDDEKESMSKKGMGAVYIMVTLIYYRELSH